MERPGEVLLREEIRKRLWPDNTVVEFEHSINAAIKRLRDVLRESAEKPRYIETLARRGYRFKGDVETPEPDRPNRATADSMAVTSPTMPAPEETTDTNQGNVPQWSARLVRRTLPVLAAVAVVFALCGWYLNYRANALVRWARQVALPEAIRLADKGQNARAFSFIFRGQQLLPGDPTLSRIRREISHAITIHTNPSGAAIWAKTYDDPDGEWLRIGTSPIEHFLLPMGYFRWKVVKRGFRPVEGAAGFQTANLDFDLDSEKGLLPPRMVHIPTADFQLNNLDAAHLDDYWMDKYEVTNKQFKQFIDEGGYATSKYWREPFAKEGQVLSWVEAMSLFRDTTGLPGPSSWQLGNYPEGQDDFPVNGLSWYEAAAYANFSNQQLPSIYHWYRAAGRGVYSHILFFSNFDGVGPRRVGNSLGLGPFGTYDMAGNVREWCLNATGSRRYIAGGAWNDKRYKYGDLNAAEPFDRSAANGFRCMKRYGTALPSAFSRPVENAGRDYRTEKPVSDEAFHIVRSLYTYDRTDLNPLTEVRADSAHGWTAERISFDAAYGHERVTAWLYLPKSARPPYQTVLYVPPRSALVLSAIDDFEIKFIEFLVRTGRAVLFPICQGMYDRRSSGIPGPSGTRDRIIQQYKDLRRSLDYLETRPDIAQDRLGFYGVSDGARLGLILLAQESRIRGAVLAAGGLPPENRSVEIDEINFIPRVRTPVLMLNGRYDLFYPAETNQAAMFHLLGTPQADKRYVLFDMGHIPFQQHEMKETLDWFDRYLGPVNRQSNLK